MEKTRVYEPKSEKYDPVTFSNVEFGSARALTGVGDARIVVDGKMSINTVQSDRYGKEIHIQVYSKEYRVEGRNPSRWSRTEVYFPIRDLGRLIDALIKIQLREEGMNV